MPTSLSADEIRVRAYLLWEAEGRQHGRDDHYWHEATRQLDHERVFAPESASIDSATGLDASKPKTAKRKGAATVGKAIAADVRPRNGLVTKGDETAGKSPKVTAERQKKATTKACTESDTKSDTASDTKSNVKAETKTAAKAKTKTKTKTVAKPKVNATAAAPKKATKSQRTKEDTGQAKASKAA